jgi:hypothetical protein
MINYEETMNKFRSAYAKALDEALLSIATKHSLSLEECRSKIEVHSYALAIDWRHDIFLDKKRVAAVFMEYKDYSFRIVSEETLEDSK